MVVEMSELFDSINQGLREAIAYSEGKCPEAAVRESPPTEVKNIRPRLNMPQDDAQSSVRTGTNPNTENRIRYALS
uniref:Uncharacterized protein n=1 Tax=Candidatus Kentrum sp. SD TaxID=2126332 RepID=A0A450Y681_9GAMM|nr:MAG: hypothetical protein BECKSD772F_GA0070984_100921 [Candidatus Kentron sp. SD]VFK43100.1 MAG: hypothetical protein BECKSD772E_GA0070983_102221 [Candidatus Kentron sp. SD]